MVSEIMMNHRWWHGYVVVVVVAWSGCKTSSFPDERQISPAQLKAVYDGSYVLRSKSIEKDRLIFEICEAYGAYPLDDSQIKNCESAFRYKNSLPFSISLTVLQSISLTLEEQQEVQQLKQQLQERIDSWLVDSNLLLKISRDDPEYVQRWLKTHAVIALFGVFLSMNRNAEYLGYFTAFSSMILHLVVLSAGSAGIKIAEIGRYLSTQELNKTNALGTLF